MSQVISLGRPQRPLNSSDVVNVLNISASTLRTYTGHFRHLGHSFSKKNGRILYSSHDLQLFQRMIQLHDQGFGTIPECVVNVLNVQNNVVDVHNVLNSVEDTMDNVDKQNKQCKQVKQPQETSSQIDTENEIARLKQEMAELRKYVDESIKKRDELLLQTLREVLESKQKKKKKWWQFWK
ncbi:MerR family transcriptional regulator [Bacillus pseudomycoides]|uniref:MerR family transcriptional regulator n=1 Tax=Bacillus pseudomycoides TaxID=64104 RepID=UPI00215B1E5A|nr:MerR family transcriptional regulator [Bacillus pseudomycoides]MCR8860419.1 MerR family transcriptional regulator [Bacillus pseudomycoides]